MPSNKKPLDLGVVVSLAVAVLALIGTIVSLAVVFGRYSAKIDNLEKDIQSLQPHIYESKETVASLKTSVDSFLERINRLEKMVYSLEGQISEPGSGTDKPFIIPSESSKPVEIVVAPDEVVIPLDAGWRPEGSIANDGGGYRDGELQLKANLTRADDYAELFLDLGSVPLAGIKPNQDGSYNLAGMELEAFVRSDQDFGGESSARNGVQFVVKEGKNWESLEGRWLHVTPAMESETGIKVFYKIPDAEISRNVAGISLKFTINSKSRATYKGSFFVNTAKIKMK